MSPLTIGTPEQLAVFLRQLDQARTLRAQTLTAQFHPYFLDLSQAALINGAKVPYNGSGYGLVMPVNGNPSGAAVTVHLDSQPLLMRPGDRAVTPFQRAEFSIANPTKALMPPETSDEIGGATTGQALFYVYTSPDTQLDLGKRVNNPHANAYTALHNSLLNIPALTTDGVSLANGRGARGFVVAGAGKTLTSGDMVWWMYDENTATWGETGSVISIVPNGRRNFPVPDEFTLVGRGRAFLEARSVITSDGSATTISLYGN